MTDTADITTPDATAPLDAYALLSKPTLKLSDAEVDIILADLRSRRARYLATGKPDKPKAERAAPKAKPTAASKAAATADLLASLNLV